MASPDALPPGPALPARKRFPWSTFLTGTIVILAVFGFGFAFTLNRDPDDDPVALPAALERVEPAPGAAAVPSQSMVLADLAFGYTGVLKVQGREIPLDQTDVIYAQDVISFTPGPEKEFRRLPAGDVIATVVFWPVQGTREADAREHSWRFTVN